MAVEKCSSSDPDRISNSCPICLASILQPSHRNSCFHKFGYKCILQWAKVVSQKLPVPASPIKCPLCKTASTSIIHKWDGNTFQRYYFSQNFEDSKEKIDLTTPPETKRKEFEALVIEGANPFLGGRSEGFVKEMESFLASGLNIEAYDEVYMQRLARSRPETASEVAERRAVEKRVIPFLYMFDEDSD